MEKYDFLHSFHLDIFYGEHINYPFHIQMYIKKQICHLQFKLPLVVELSVGEHFSKNILISNCEHYRSDPNS